MRGVYHESGASRSLFLEFTDCSGQSAFQFFNLAAFIPIDDGTISLPCVIGTDNLDVEGMAHSMSIDEHLQFTEDAESTRRMFLRERKARVNYNAYIQSDCERPVGSFFDDED